MSHAPDVLTQTRKDAGADFSIRTRIDEYATPLEEARILGGSADAVGYLESNTE